MSKTDGYQPAYADIMGQVSRVTYNQSEYSSTTVDRLKEKCFYKLRDGTTVAGTLSRMESCETRPHVMITVTSGGNTPHFLKGTLFGSPSKLGVSLDDVVEIE